VIPLALSAFTHVWNPIGFPTIHADENTYMLRSLVALEGKGVLNTTPSFFDHPYFSQIFLASVFGLMGYPQVINPTAGDILSIEMLHMVPRVLMGVLAVVDTFLIYKIAERRYNRNVAFIAAILFAVMPLSWLLRRVLLDNLLLPFLLTSILFSLYCPHPNRSYSIKDSGTKKQVSNDRNINVIIITLLSGIFLGLAIFSKVPAFAMIPLVGFFIYKNNNKSWKSLGLWFIPVILIPLLWPGYAASEGLFDNWLQAALDQATRREREPLIDAVYTFLKIDPALLVLGLGSIGFAILKRDYLILLWTVPYLIFLYLISFVDVIHLVLILPAFCIGTSRMLEGVRYLLSKIVVRMAAVFSSYPNNYFWINMHYYINSHKPKLSLFLNFML
jgi:4-amino-4-deoxy-L-arabinose transferase-like glycosyltransferase